MILNIDLIVLTDFPCGPSIGPKRPAIVRPTLVLDGDNERHDTMELRVQPLQRTLDVAPGTNLLDALRRHEVPISYSCMAGRCGTCRCRLVKGLACDAADRPDAYVLACQTSLTEPCTVEIPETDDVVVHIAKVLKATVLSIDAPTHDIRRIRLKAAKRLDFSPGQYAQLQFTPEHVRPYSMAGLPDDEALEFHVRVVPDGRVSGHVARALAVGDSVRVSGPLGCAYLRRKHAGPMLCVAGGTGLAPILSLVRGAMAEGMRNPIHLYFGVRAARDLYGREQLAALQRDHPFLQVHVVLSSGQAPDCRTGLVAEAIASDWQGSTLAGFRAYLCGAPPMVDATSLRVRQLGIEADRIHADAFYASGS